MLWKLIKILDVSLLPIRYGSREARSVYLLGLSKCLSVPFLSGSNYHSLRWLGSPQRFSFSLSLRQREQTWHPPVRCLKQCLLVTSLFEQVELDMGPLEMFPEVTKMTGAGDPLFYLKLVVSCLQFSILSNCRVGMPGVWAQTFHSLRQRSAVSKYFPTLAIQWLLWNCYTYLKVRRLSLK